MKTLIALLATSFALAAQTAAVDWQVHILGPDVIQAKYGRTLPKTIYAGSVTAVNKSTSKVVFGHGVALQVLRAAGYPALSREDAIAVVSKAQGTGVAGVWARWAPSGVRILDDIKDLQVLKVISFGPIGDAILVTADEVAKRTVPDLSAALQSVYQTYERDGIQNLMQLAPGDSLVGTLLFETTGKDPAAVASAVFTVQLPVSK